MLPTAGLYGRILREIEMPLIEIALDATGGNQAKCADLLGINRNTLRKKITELDIEVTRRPQVDVKRPHKLWRLRAYLLLETTICSGSGA